MLSAKEIKETSVPLPLTLAACSRFPVPAPDSMTCLAQSKALGAVEQLYLELELLYYGIVQLRIPGYLHCHVFTSIIVSP